MVPVYFFHSLKYVLPSLTTLIAYLPSQTVGLNI